MQTLQTLTMTMETWNFWFGFVSDCKKYTTLVHIRIFVQGTMTKPNDKSHTGFASDIHTHNLITTEVAAVGVGAPCCWRCGSDGGNGCCSSSVLGSYGSGGTRLELAPFGNELGLYAAVFNKHQL